MVLMPGLIMGIQQPDETLSFSWIIFKERMIFNKHLIFEHIFSFLNTKLSWRKPIGESSCLISKWETFHLQKRRSEFWFDIKTRPSWLLCSAQGSEDASWWWFFSIFCCSYLGTSPHLNSPICYGHTWPGRLPRSEARALQAWKPSDFRLSGILEKKNLEFRRNYMFFLADFVIFLLICLVSGLTFCVGRKSGHVLLALGIGKSTVSVGR